ncbi:MAG: 50S ribosomal protein L33 [Candidatus Caldipriscus sp.]
MGVQVPPGLFMAKKPQGSHTVGLKCSVCGRFNYAIRKNRSNRKKIELRKYCKWCRKHIHHTEGKL